MNQSLKNQQPEIPKWKAILAGGFYFIASLSLIIFNKVVFTSYHYHEEFLLLFAQMLATLIFLITFNYFGLIKLPELNWEGVKKISILPISFIIMLAAGWSGLGKTSLPIFSALRRLTVIFVLFFEYFLLKIVPSKGVFGSVAVGVIGAIIAGWTDLYFDLTGYSMAFLCNFGTALYTVQIKVKKNEMGFDEFGLLFYNAVITLFISWSVVLFKGDGGQLAELAYSNNGFIFAFIFSSCMGFLVNYAIYFNTTVNSALTTNILGQSKDFMVLMFSIFYFEDFQYQILNVIGISLSMLGAVIYFLVKLNIF